MAQGKLNAGFSAAGFSADVARKSYRNFYAILGDTDTATEASQLLANMAKNEEEVTKWTRIAAGVHGTFGDSLPIEGLVENTVTWNWDEIHAQDDAGRDRRELAGRDREHRLV